MLNTTFDTNGYTININVDEDSTNWLVVKDETYRPDRGAFILERFKEDYPDIDVKGKPSLVYALCSRSSALNKWLANQNLKYALIQNEPTFYRDILDEGTYNSVSKELIDNSTHQKNRATEELEAAKKYRDEMQKIENKYSKFKFKTKEARVISMNTTELPLTLQLAIENYTPANDTSPNQKSFAREVLINYKISLLNLITDSPEIDIEAFIKVNCTK